MSSLFVLVLQWLAPDPGCCCEALRVWARVTAEQRAVHGPQSERAAVSWVVDRIEGGQVIVEDGEDFFEVPVATWGSACFFEGLVLVDGRPSPQQALQRYSEGWARLERLRSRSEAGSAGMWSASTVAMDGAGADKGLERP